MGSVALFFLVSFALASSSLGDSVPVVVWGSQSKNLPVLTDLSSEGFAEIISTNLKDSMVVVFAENKLVSEDISLCKKENGDSCYSYLSQINKKAYYSNVADPIESLYELTDDVDHVYVNSAGELDRAASYKVGRILFVAFNEQTIDRSTELQAHDELMEKVVKDLESSGKVVALYTGKASNSLIRTARQAASNSTETKDVTISLPQLLAHYESITYKPADGSAKNIVVSSSQIVNSTSDVITVKFTAGSDIITFNMQNLFGYWYMNNLMYNDIGLYTENNVSAVDGFSYYCGQTTVFTDPAGNALTWKNLQIEPNFGNSTAKFESFNDPYNCVGFTSIPIWSGLFVTFMLLFIVSIGISWMMDINTMDRFDDPKGKTIIVNASD